MLRFSKKGFINALIAILFFVTLLDIVAYFINSFFPYDIYENIFLYYFEELFDANLESNIPTFFSVVLILINSILLYLIAKIDKIKGKFVWYVWSFLFLFMAIDELAQIHERINAIMGTYELHYLFSQYGWVSVYAIVVLVILIASISFFIKLPKKTKTYLIFASLMYAFGALLFEVAGGMCVDDKTLGYNTFLYNMATTLEEFLEMAAMILFAKAFLDYLYNISNHKLRIELLD